MVTGAILLAAVGLAGCSLRPCTCECPPCAPCPTPPAVIEPTASPSASPEPTPPQPVEPEAEAETELVFDNHNIYAVANQPTAPTVFSLEEPRHIYSIQNYHWNLAQGQTPGTIGLEDEEGNTYGPWPAEGSPGQGGVPDAYWTCYPDTKLPAGTYTVVDSDPASWSQNSGTEGCGMTKVYALK